MFIRPSRGSPWRESFQHIVKLRLLPIPPLSGKARGRNGPGPPGPPRPFVMAPRKRRRELPGTAENLAVAEPFQTSTCWEKELRSELRQSHVKETVVLSSGHLGVSTDLYMYTVELAIALWWRTNGLKGSGIFYQPAEGTTWTNAPGVVRSPSFTACPTW